MNRNLAQGLVLAFAGCEAVTETLELAPPPGPIDPIEPVDPGCRPAWTWTAYTIGDVAQDLGVFTRVGGGLVYAHRGPDGIPGRTNLDIIAIDPLGGGEELIAGTRRPEILLDANGEAAMWSRTDFEVPDPPEVVVRWPPSELAITTDSPVFDPFGPGGFEGRQPRMIDSTAAAYRTRSGVWRIDPGFAPRLLRASTMSGGEPQVRRGVVAFTEYGNDGSESLFIQKEGAEIDRVESPYFRNAWPAVGDRRIFFAGDGRLVSLDLDTGDIVEHHPGPCGPPATDGLGAVAACDPTGQLGYPSPGRLLVHFDGVETRQLFDGEGYHFAPRLESGRIAWLWYPSADALCGGGSDRRGEVRFHDPNAFVAAEPIAPVLAPCLCCDAYWAPPELDFEGDVIAFSYAAGVGEPTRFGGLGYAVLRRGQVCP